MKSISHFHRGNTTSTLGNPNAPLDKYTCIYLCSHILKIFVGTRAQNIMVTVSVLEADIMHNGADNECGFIAGIAQQFNNLVTCSRPMIGQFVQLQMIGTDYLNLYEVEVYGFALNP